MYFVRLKVYEILCIDYFSDHLSHFPTSNEQLLTSLTQLASYYESVYSLAENVRYAHEYGTMTVDIPHNNIAEDSRDLFEAKVLDKTLEVKYEPAPESAAVVNTVVHAEPRARVNGSETEESTNAKDMFEQR